MLLSLAATWASSFGKWNGEIIGVPANEFGTEGCIWAPFAATHRWVRVLAACGPGGKGDWAAEAIACFPAKAQDQKRIYPGDRGLRNQFARGFCRRRLHSGARRRLHRDGGPRWKTCRACNSRKVGGTWLP